MYVCDQCAEVSVPQDGDVCEECQDEYEDALAEVAWANGEAGWTPGER